MPASSGSMRAAAATSTEPIAARHLEHIILGHSWHSPTCSVIRGGSLQTAHTVVCPTRDTKPLSLGRRACRVDADAAPAEETLFFLAVDFFLFGRRAAVPLLFVCLLEVRGATGKTNSTARGRSSVNPLNRKLVRAFR